MRTENKEMVESRGRRGRKQNNKNSTRARTQRRQRQRFHHHIDAQRLLASAGRFHGEIDGPRQLVDAAPVVLVLELAQPRRQLIRCVRETQHVGVRERVRHATAGATAAVNE